MGTHRPSAGRRPGLSRRAFLRRSVKQMCRNDFTGISCQICRMTSNMLRETDICRQQMHLSLQINSLKQLGGLLLGGGGEHFHSAFHLSLYSSSILFLFTSTFVDLRGAQPPLLHHRPWINVFLQHGEPFKRLSDKVFGYRVTCAEIRDL